LKKFLLGVMCVALFHGAGLATQAATDDPGILADHANMDPQDIEIINDLDMFENWDDLQDEKGFENFAADVQETTGGGHGQ
jgi:hypothetical protein